MKYLQFFNDSSTNHKGGVYTSDDDIVLNFDGNKRTVYGKNKTNSATVFKPLIKSDIEDFTYLVDMRKYLRDEIGWSNNDVTNLLRELGDAGCYFYDYDYENAITLYNTWDSSTTSINERWRNGGPSGDQLLNFWPNLDYSNVVDIYKAWHGNQRWAIYYPTMEFTNENLNAPSGTWWYMQSFIPKVTINSTAVNCIFHEWPYAKEWYFPRITKFTYTILAGTESSLVVNDPLNDFIFNVPNLTGEPDYKGQFRQFDVRLKSFTFTGTNADYLFIWSKNVHIGDLHLETVINPTRMFYGCTSIKLGDIYLNNAETLYNMFDTNDSYIENPRYQEHIKSIGRIYCENTKDISYVFYSVDPTINRTEFVNFGGFIGLGAGFEPIAEPKEEHILDLTFCIAFSDESINNVINGLGTVPQNVTDATIKFPSHITLSDEQIAIVENKNWHIYRPMLLMMSVNNTSNSRYNEIDDTIINNMNSTPA